MAYFIGCDVSKVKLDLCLIDGLGTEQWTDKVTNDETSIATFLLSLSGSYPGVTCVVEATGSYHLAFAQTAYVLGLRCLVYNPLLTKQQIRATVRGRKTDRTDALIIARLGLRGEGRAYAPEPYLLTKSCARGQQRLSQYVGALSLYQTHIKDFLGDAISNETQVALDQVRLAFNKASQSFSRDMVASSPVELSKLLQSIPGVGPYIASSIIGEIQDMSRFRNSKQLIAYAGMDPKIKQSGHTLNSTGRLTKRGSPYLRRSLFIGANIARQYDAGFKALYDKKRDEGKPYTVAICVVARRLLVVARAVWLRNAKYDSSMWTDQPVKVGRVKVSSRDDKGRRI